MKQVKKKNLVPLIVFLLSMCLVGFIVYKTDTHEKWQRRTTAQLNVSTYGERIKNEITNGIAITDTLPFFVSVCFVYDETNKAHAQ